MEYTVYAHIDAEEWKLYMMYKDEPVFITGKEHQENYTRIEIQSMLEILQFLRNWVSDQKVSFIIYINSQYCMMCVHKWIPNWIQKKFRISNSVHLRPNTDLLVKLHSFSQCMSFELIQHYDDFETYKNYYPMCL